MIKKIILIFIYLTLFSIVHSMAMDKKTYSPNKNDIYLDSYKNLTSNNTLTYAWREKKIFFSKYKNILILKFINQDKLESLQDPKTEYILHKYLTQIFSRINIFPSSVSNDNTPKDLYPDQFYDYKENLILAGVITKITYPNKIDKPLKWGDEPFSITIQFAVIDNIKSKTIIRAIHTRSGISINDCVDKICSDIASYFYEIELISNNMGVMKN
jgi:hypothetical protein